MVLFLLLLLVAIGLGFAGFIVNGLFYLLIIGAVVLVADLVYAGARAGRRWRRPAR